MSDTADVKAAEYTGVERIHISINVFHPYQHFDWSGLSNQSPIPPLYEYSSVPLSLSDIRQLPRIDAASRVNDEYSSNLTGSVRVPDTIEPLSSSVV